MRPKRGPAPKCRPPIITDTAHILQLPQSQPSPLSTSGSPAEGAEKAGHRAPRTQPPTSQPLRRQATRDSTRFRRKSDPLCLRQHSDFCAGVGRTSTCTPFSNAIAKPRPERQNALVGPSLTPIPKLKPQMSGQLKIIWGVLSAQQVNPKGLRQKRQWQNPLF